MSRSLFWLSDEAWLAIEPHLPRNQPGARRVDDRRVISGIIHMLKCGGRWADCPAEYGPATTVYNRWNRWSRRGIWTRILAVLTEEGWIAETGQITAQVTENIYDSPTGRILLVPQGTRVIGQYDNNVQFGQSRVLLVWNRLIFPNGRSIVLERQPGADAEGYAGLQDGVDYHWWDLANAAGLSTLLTIGAELATNDDDRLIQAIRNGGQDTSTMPVSRSFAAS